MKSGSVKDLLLRGEQSYQRIEGDEFQEVRQFAAAFGYSVSETTYRHEIFGNDTMTLYPQERTFIPGKQKTKAEEVHRPVLDLERVGGKWFRPLLPGPVRQGAPTTGRKDITADAEGKVTLTNVILMNLGNPFKALLWVEDYLKNKEHGHGASPVLRSWLIPLDDVRWMLSGRCAPLDRDRASGQFGQFGTQDSIYADKLHPLQSSLVSFFVDPDEAGTADRPEEAADALLQHFLTGVGGDPRQMAKGIAAQHRPSRAQRGVLREAQRGVDLLLRVAGGRGLRAEGGGDHHRRPRQPEGLSPRVAVARGLRTCRERAAPPARQ